jgi:hypothetical protein
MRRSEIEKKDSESATTGKTGGKILIPIGNDNIAIAPLYDEKDYLLEVNDE